MQVAEGVCKHLKEAFRRRYADSAGGNAAADDQRLAKWPGRWREECECGERQ